MPLARSALCCANVCLECGCVSHLPQLEVLPTCLVVLQVCDCDTGSAAVYRGLVCFGVLEWQTRGIGCCYCVSVWLVVCLAVYPGGG